MTTPAPIYDRAPSRELQNLLVPGALLASLVELAGKQVGGHRHAVYLRVRNEVHVYRGRTVLVNAKRLANGLVRLKADPKYTGQPIAEGLFREWKSDETGFGEALNHYLSNVEVGQQWTNGEGAVQEQWCQVREPWKPFDREGELGGPHARGIDFPAIEDAKSNLEVLEWCKDKDIFKVTSKKIDQMAIDPQGRLVLLELKDASKSDDKIYNSPFQLLQYVWEWHNALETVRNDLQSVINARVAVGLTPPGVPPLSGGIRAAVGFGADRRTAEVKRRYAMVLEVVNRHLPEGVDPIETWAIPDSVPVLVD